jgi:hypothetical protein
MAPKLKKLDWIMTAEDQPSRFPPYAFDFARL